MASNRAQAYNPNSVAISGRGLSVCKSQDAGVWPFFSEDEIEAVARVMRSGKVNYWTGQEGKSFEVEFAAFTECRHAIGIANGSLALECALRGLDIGPGDDVVTTARTFIASASCAVMVGARPVMADVNRESQNLTADTIRQAITPRTKAIIAVHLAGWPCEMDEILQLARERDIKVIEDCAQAHGSTYKGRPVGSFGDAAAFSFCQDKIMTTVGEGGMVTTNSTELWERMWSLKEHGKSYDAAYRRRHPPGFRWLHECFGSNWRMTEVQSAVGRIQLLKVPQWVEARRKNAALLSECFSQLRGLRVTVPPAHTEHSYYKYYAFVRPEALRPGWDRDRILASISEAGVACFSGSCSEIYLEKAFPLDMRPQSRLSIARELGETSLMFLVHPTLEHEQIAKTCHAVESIMHEATR
jgi:dTDP-4-amino-4,6-dideoxygalactose transaminase